MQKKIFLILLLMGNIIIAQEDKTVTLTVSGSGQTLEESKTNALRSAIEQAFGAFISSKTEILNDNLVKDEIVSVSNGNIQKFDIISELQIPDGGYATSIKATVSISKLTSFVESKGIVVEFKGGLFASNVLMQELYEKNELKAIKNVIITLDAIAKKSFDYTIAAEEPYSNSDKWAIPIKINVYSNSNFINIPTLIEQTLQSLSLSESEIINYKKLNKMVFPVTLATLNNSRIYYLRNDDSQLQILKFIYSLNSDVSNFKISNGLSKKTISEYNYYKKRPSVVPHNYNGNNLIIDDINFRLLLKGHGGGCFCPASLFHNNGCGINYYTQTLNFNYEEILKEALKYENINAFKVVYGGGYEDSCRLFGKKNSIDYMNHYYNLKKLMTSSEKGIDFGIVISFAGINSGDKVVQFKFDDLITLDEIKQITKYEILKN